MKTYRVHYKQKFMGEVLEDSYIRTVNDEGEKYRIEAMLYDDPHVFSVSFEEIKSPK